MFNFQRDLYGEFSAARADVIFWQELYRRVNPLVPARPGPVSDWNLPDIDSS